MLHQDQVAALTDLFNGVPAWIVDRANGWREAFHYLTGQHPYVPQEILAMWIAEYMQMTRHPQHSAFTQPGQQPSPATPYPVQPQPAQHPAQPLEEEEGPLDFTGMKSDSMAPAHFESTPTQQLTLTRLAEIVANGQPVPATFIHPQTNRLANGMIVGQQGNLAKVAFLTDAAGNQDAVLVSPESIQA